MRRHNPAKQAIGHRTHNQPEVATEMRRVADRLIPQWPWTGPWGPQASQVFSFSQKNMPRDCYATELGERKLSTRDTENSADIYLAG